MTGLRKIIFGIIIVICVMTAPLYCTDSTEAVVNALVIITGLVIGGNILAKIKYLRGEINGTLDKKDDND